MITADNAGRADDFINESEKDATPANDAGRVAKLESDGRLGTFFTKVKFGGDGSDGALSIASGTTTVDLGGAQVVIKNYTSISITGTGKLAFSNPHANGTVIVLKSKGNVTLTSSQAPMIDCSNTGAIGGASATVGPSAISNGNAGTDGKCFGIIPTTIAGKATAGSGAGGTLAISAYPSSFLSKLFGKFPSAFMGAGGGSGSASAGTTSTVTLGAGGRGGGCLIIECGGYINYTTAGGISVGGSVGGSASVTGSNRRYQGAGGGAGGFCALLYNFVTAITGTITVSGGAGSAGSAKGSTPAGTIYSGGGGGNYQAGNAGSSDIGSTGGAGANGLSIIDVNTEF